MRSVMNRAMFAAVAAIALTEMASVSQAAVWNATGAADWSTTANWDTGIAPDATKDGLAATLNSGTAVYTGTPFNIAGAGAQMTLSGGSFRWDAPAGSPANVNVWWGGQLVVNAGSFDIGSKELDIGGNALIAKGTVSITGGSISARTALLIGNGSNQIAISGGSVSFTGDLNLQNGSVGMSGGTLNANYVSFYDPSSIGTTLTFSGGTMNLTGGIWSWDSSKGYVNFTDGSTGIIHLVGDTAGDAARAQLANGAFRENGVADASLFSVTTDSSGSYVQLVPEPASITLIAVPALALMRRRAKR